MPIYAFRCAACGHAFDRLQKMSDPDPAQCPVCAAPAVERQLTAPSFRLSGSGWYETDFKKDGDSKRNLAGEGGEAAAKGERKGEEGKGEAKPDAKTETKTDSKPAGESKAADSKTSASKTPSTPVPTSGKSDA